MRTAWIALTGVEVCSLVQITLTDVEASCSLVRIALIGVEVRNLARILLLREEVISFSNSEPRVRPLGARVGDR